MTLDSIVLKDLKTKANSKKALFLKKFFKTGPGEYGEGDKFLGVIVPDQRKIAKKYGGLIAEKELEVLIKSPYHEVRLTAVYILVSKFEKAKSLTEKSIWVEFYLLNRAGINNWDLVDSSAPQILGALLFDKDRSILYEFANSGALWDQRIAVLSTFNFVRKNDFVDTFNLALILLHHEHDLIHKAVGWMIREVGNRDYGAAYQFLKHHYHTMPRTMQRYAIEKFDMEERKRFLKGEL